MPRPSGPPLLVACYDGRLKDVRALLASGADPRAEPSPAEQQSVFPTHSLATAAMALARHADGAPMVPNTKRMNELICECGGDLGEVVQRIRAARLGPD